MTSTVPPHVIEQLKEKGEALEKTILGSLNLEDKPFFEKITPPLVSLLWASRREQIA